MRVLQDFSEVCHIVGLRHGTCPYIVYVRFINLICDGFGG